MSNPFDDFNKRMQARANEFEKGVEHAVRGAALVADQVVVTSTPVDTGRARANWITSIGSPSFETEESYSSTGAEAQAIEQGKTVIADWKVGAGPIFISNNVEYAQYLDEGSSAQAPNGMTAQAVQAAQAYLARHLKPLSER